MKNRKLDPLLRLAPIAAGIVLMVGADKASAASPLSAMTAANSLAAAGVQRDVYSPWAPRYGMSLSDFQRTLPGASPMPASTKVVQNCNDAGAGSLRATIATAVSGDTIDLTQLHCVITLMTGQIDIQQNTLTLNGPGSDKLTIDGGYSTGHLNRIFRHAKTGSLSISGMTLADAKYAGTTQGIGGCIASGGTVVVSNSTLSSCRVQSQGSSTAAGGAIFAQKGLLLLNSIVTNNSAVAASASGQVLGGGIYCEGNLSAKYSTISDNSGLGGTATYGGGIYVQDGNVYLLSTTISGNAGTFGGGLHIQESSGALTTKIYDSTISNNLASGFGAGVNTNASLTIANSTIAFNRVNGANGWDGAGVNAAGGTVNLQSSIIAMNTSPAGLSDTFFQGPVSGSNNLVTQSNGTIPPDAISNCPLLGHLANNGGSTKTHALRLNSPALDLGNNTTGSNGTGFTWDQRGSGHPRTWNAVTDIGAFESDGTIPDDIFSSQFENRCN